MADTSPVPDPQNPGVVAVRWLFAVLLLVVAALLVPLAITGVWIKNQVANTERYVETVAPLAKDAAIQRAIADRTAKAVTAAVDVPQLLDEAIGPKAQVLAPPIEAAFTNVVDDVTLKLAQSKQFDKLWIAANRDGHNALVKALEGNKNAAPNAVAVDLSGTTAKVAEKLKSLGVPLTLDASTSDSTTLELYSSRQIGKIRGYYQLATTAAGVAPWAVVALLVLGALVAPNRRQGAIGAGIALALGAAMLLTGFGIGRDLFIANAQSADAAANLFDILVRFVRSATRAALALGVVVAVVGWAFGPSTAAVGLRRGLGRATSAAGDAASSRGVGGGAAGRWAGEHRSLLHGVVGLVAAATLVLWNRPTANVVLWLALASLLALLLIEVLVRSAQGTVEDAAGSGDDGSDAAGGSDASDGSGDADEPAPADA
ncbi:MAG: hypothetical protein ACKO04_12450 [Actinomycetes bacterium]